MVVKPIQNDLLESSQRKFCGASDGEEEQFSSEPEEVQM